MAAIHIRVVMQLNMKMGRIHAAVRADSAYLGAAQHQLSQHNVNIVQMGIKSLAAKNLSGLGFTESMAHNHHLSPTRPGRPPHKLPPRGLRNKRDRPNRNCLLYCRSNPRPCDTFQAQTAGPVIAVAVRLPYRKIKTVTKRNKRKLAVPPGHVNGSALADQRGTGQKNQRQQ